MGRKLGDGYEGAIVSENRAIGVDSAIGAAAWDSRLQLVAALRIALTSRELGEADVFPVDDPREPLALQVAREIIVDQVNQQA